MFRKAERNERFIRTFIAAGSDDEIRIVRLLSVRNIKRRGAASNEHCRCADAVECRTDCEAEVHECGLP